MRLSKIKLAGFKSFVDPTTIDLRSNLTGIVGPNGCGKSNTIDAVRWVMGESSAKHLRGSSMEDVIFNGSSARKPVGQASVELVFDNSDASLGGEYAKYSEIAIKRLVARDGTAKYFLNGSKCRRRDITDIVLGTGLGPRSYAIIEQGMISRLIDAKPEELRVYLEEAAGISKYRQRRRETETRIRHTRENLDRLSDLREEIDKHLAQLKRQSNAAERYKEYKAQERRLEAELLVLRLQELKSSVAVQEEKIVGQGILQQEKIATLRATESEIERQRVLHTESHDKQNVIQGEYYKLGAEISRIEQAINHQKEVKARYEQQVAHLAQELETSQRHLNEDQATEKVNQADLEHKQQELELLSEELAEKKMLHEEAEATYNEWQEKWSLLQQSIAEPTQQAQIERARMEQLERQIQQNKQRMERLANDSQQIQLQQLMGTVETGKLDLAQAEERYTLSTARLDEVRLAREEGQQTVKDLQQQLNEYRSRQQSVTGRLASLTALQQASLGKDKGKTTQWLNNRGLGSNPRLAESLHIDIEWQKALETVLASQLESVLLDDLDSLQVQLVDRPADMALSFLSRDAAVSVDNQNLLLAKITAGREAVAALLAGIYCAGDLSSALQQRASLEAHESIICKDGIWVGKNWLRIHSANAQQDGVIQRNQEIKQLTAEQEQLGDSIHELSSSLDAQEQQRKTLNLQYEQLQNEHNEMHRKQSQLESTVNATLQRIEQTRLREQQSTAEKEELQQQIETLEEEHIAATQLRNKAVTDVETLSKEREILQQRQSELAERVNHTRQSLQQAQGQQQQLQHQIESLTQSLQQLRQHITRADERISNLQMRREEIQQEFELQQIPDEDYSAQLEALLQQRQHAEEKLKDARTELQSIDHQIRSLNERRVLEEQAIESVRDVLEQMKLTWQESSVRVKTLMEQFEQTDFELADIEQNMPEGAAIKPHQQELEAVKQRIQRLGAINLAAIDEYKQESERKVYLDQQNDDLMEALDTLEKAIGKIDKDTRHLFKDTFDKVNTLMGEMFPRLFGGGKAYLEMTDSDLLTTGVVIMARPPGKRISNIQLMSGGEKALTAAAMVFAIFELNPAPFCMLDEVDAPLDEANVRRFADLVKHMSQRIQFIFITHNKTTMEVAENLVGVTMRELGVSRTVTVNVSEAAEMVKE